MVLVFLLEKPWYTAVDRFTFLARSAEVRAGILATHVDRLISSLAGAGLVALLVGYMVWHFGVMLRYTDR